MIISSDWHDTRYEAWRQFNLEYAWKIKKRCVSKFEWIKEPIVLEENGRFKVEGVTQ